MVLDKNDDVGLSKSDAAPDSINRVSVHRYCAAIETAVQTNQFDECAMLLSELIGNVSDFYKGETAQHPKETVEHNKRTVAQAQNLLYRCRDPLLAGNHHEQGKLRDDVRNGLVLLLSDVLDCEQQSI